MCLGPSALAKPFDYAYVNTASVYEFHEDGRHALLDYTICHPCAASYVGAASRTQLSTAAQAERLKEGEYKQASEAEGYHFSPVAFETYGAFGLSATWFLDRATDIIKNKLPEGTITTWTAGSFRAFYAQRFSIALMRGNARIIRLRASRDMRVDGRAGMDPPAAAAH